MIITRHNLFRKHYKKRILPYRNLDRRFENRLKLFLQDPQNPELKDHRLIGSLKGLRAFAITGDIRVVYQILNDVLELYDVGSHAQVY